MPSDPPAERRPLSERWDLLPYRGLKAVAEVMYDGESLYPGSAWRGYPFSDSHEAPLNHAIAHAARAMQFLVGSRERRRQMAKAAANLLMQIDLEESSVASPIRIEGLAEGRKEGD